MELQVTDFSLQGCRCRLKFDPKELQELLSRQLKAQSEKHKKLKSVVGGPLNVSGQFLEIDEGNLALHIMCAFLGKPKIVSVVQLTNGDQILWEDKIEMSSSGTCFHSMRALLKQDVHLLATEIVKRTVKVLKQ